MFSKLATELKSSVYKYINDGSKENGDIITLTCCKINNISCMVKVIIGGKHKHPDTIHIGLQIDTMLDISDGSGDSDCIRLYFKWIVEDKKKDEINYEEFYEKVYAIIPTLRISKQKGKFLTADDISLVVADEISKLFTHPNVELHTCCVCLEMCGGVIIECGHDICVECVNQIKPKKDEDDDDCERIHCPLCRQTIGF